MKALTLYQPWASLVAEGIKTVETRSWAPPPAVIGERIAIHAGTTRVRPDPGLRRAIETALGRSWGGDLPRGAVVATAALAGSFYVLELAPDGSVICEGRGKTPGELLADPFGDFRKGRWLWTLEDIRRIAPPLPARGSRKLWELELKEETR